MSRIPSAACKKRSAPFKKPIYKPISLIGPRSWYFLNETGDLDIVGWNGSERSKLWRYNQHYFDDLNAKGSMDRSHWHIELINLWITENNIGYGNAWEPYPTSLRIVNWVKWLLMNDNKSLLMDDNKMQLIHDSLVIQGSWLIKNLEYHILGNHLFSNAKALIFLGLFFSGNNADKWLKKGLHLLNNELDEQILEDGGHFELSPMYHAIVLEDVLDIINILNCFQQRLRSFNTYDLEKRLVVTAKRMMIWLSAMSHPDGEISFFNDACFNIAPSTLELKSYAKRQNIAIELPKRPCTYFEASGYVSVHKGEGFIIHDVASVGPTYLPGHGHADTLSIEFSLLNQRIIVNSGISTYEDNAERLSQRSTPAHNTVCVNSQNSSEVWSSFRVGRRANVHNTSVSHNADGYKIKSQHDGYKYLQKNCTHFRETELKNDKLIIFDQVKTLLPSTAFFHFHPHLILEQHTENRGIILLSGQKLCEWSTNNTKAKLIRSKWHPKFGVTMENSTLSVGLENGQCIFLLKW